jgi:type I restriction enzyme S subunit
MVYEGDFILSNSMSFGRPYIMKTSGCIHDGWLVLREREPKINQDYLYYVLGSDLVFHQFDRLAAGSTVRNLNIGLVKGVEIPIPSASEQRRIVGILDEAFEGIATAKANAEKNLQNARALFKGHLQSVFTRPGLGWLEKTLEEAVDSKCSLSYGIVQPGEDKPGGLPIVRPTDLRARTIEMEGLKRIDPSLAESYRRTTLRGGDLLLCVRGSTGVVSVAAEELAGGNVTRGIVPIHFDDQFVAQDFGYYLMCSTPVQKQIREKTYGAALMQINICDLRNLILPIPPRPIQEALANRFESLLAETDRLASIYQQKLAALDELKKSLLHQAFSGEL